MSKAYRSLQHVLDVLRRELTEVYHSPTVLFSACVVTMQEALDQLSPASSSEDESETEVVEEDNASLNFKYYRLQQSDELYFDATKGTYVARVPPLLLLCVDHYAELLIRSVSLLPGLLP